jgi:hypothetical protein
VSARGVGDVDAAQHPRDLLDARRAAERRDLRAGGATVGELRDAQVPIRERRHLRQVRHAQHLRAATERREFTADDLGDRAAHTRIHFVEDAAEAGLADVSCDTGRPMGEGDLHGQ